MLLTATLCLLFRTREQVTGTVTLLRMHDGAVFGDYIPKPRSLPNPVPGATSVHTVPGPPCGGSGSAAHGSVHSLAAIADDVFAALDALSDVDLSLCERLEEARVKVREPL